MFRLFSRYASTRFSLRKEVLYSMHRTPSVGYRSPKKCRYRYLLRVNTPLMGLIICFTCMKCPDANPRPCLLNKFSGCNYLLCFPNKCASIISPMARIIVFPDINSQIFSIGEISISLSKTSLAVKSQNLQLSA